MARPFNRRLMLAGATTMALGLVWLGTPQAGQMPGGQRPPGADYTGQAFTFSRITEDVYHAVGTGALTVMCNAAVIINAHDVLVVDSHVSPAGAWALREELKALTPKPIRFVVNTHFHFDHTHGNQLYGAEVEIIGHEFTRSQLVSGGSKTSRSYGTFIGAVPRQIDQLTERIRTAPDAAERAKLEGQLAILERHRRATDVVTPTPPTVTLSNAMTLYRGGREIRLLHLGRGHTGGDVVVFLPKERIVVTGDLQTAATAYMGDAYFTEWVATLDRLKSLDFDTVLPGHGQAFTGKDRIDHWQAYLRDFWTQVQDTHKAGVGPAEAAKTIDMRKQAVNFPQITQPGVSLDGVLRAYEILEGTVR